MKANTEVKNYGIGFLPILTLIFITLKLTGYIAWSWWLVLLPMIIQLSLALIVLIIVIIYYYNK